MPRIESNVVDIPAIPWLDCPAKTKDGGFGETVLQHSKKVEDVARELINIMPDFMIDKYSLPVICGSRTHDTGKISPGFDKKMFNNLPAEAQEELRNDPIFMYLCKLFGMSFEDNHAKIGNTSLRTYAEASIANILSIIAYKHHGATKYDIADNDESERYGSSTWSEQRKLFIEHQLADLTADEKRALSEIIDIDIIDTITGFVSISDHIASNNSLFEDINNNDASKALQLCGWKQLDILPNLSFKDIFGYSPYDVQYELSNNITKNAISIVEAPTGLGKTEAALYAAYKLLDRKEASGIYFALPTRTTSNKIYERIQPFIKTISNNKDYVKLAHGKAWMYENNIQSPVSDSSIKIEGKNWFDYKNYALLSQFAVGTIDQSLLGVLPVRYNTLRKAGLAGKVVILDEIHSYDVFTNTLIHRLINLLSKIDCTVIILSATLTNKMRTQILESDDINKHDYPLITIKQSTKIKNIKVRSQGVNKNIKVTMQETDYCKSAEIAINRARAGQRVGCIMNTVKECQHLYKLIKSKTSDDIKIGILHSNYPEWKRIEIEKEWLDALGKDGDAEGCILVSTQVLEQSVDIDFDFLITKLCPIDMLIQRLGRLWRHIRERIAVCPEVLIMHDNIDKLCKESDLSKIFGFNDHFVYSTYILFRTYEVIKNTEVINTPEDVKTLLEAVYKETEHKNKNIQELFEKDMIKKDSLENLAATITNENYNELYDDAEVETRHSNIRKIGCLLIKQSNYKKHNTITLSNDIEVTIIPGLKDRETDIQIHRNLVSLPSYVFDKFDLRTEEFLQKYFNTRTPILKIGFDGRISFYGKYIGYKYNDVIGLEKYKLGEDE